MKREQRESEAKEKKERIAERVLITNNTEVLLFTVDADIHCSLMIHPLIT